MGLFDKITKKNEFSPIYIGVFPYQQEVDFYGQWN